MAVRQYEARVVSGALFLPKQTFGVLAQRGNSATENLAERLHFYKQLPLNFHIRI